MRIVFMGTPDFAAVSLQRLLDERFDVVGVFTQPDKPKNRGMKLQPSPVKEIALAAGLPVFQPAKMRDGTALADLQSLQPDILVVVAYGRILPDDLLAVAPYGAVNVHGSLLPKYRGAAPIQWAVLNGDKITGVTIMQMADGIDTGDMLAKAETPIGEDETAGELFDRLMVLGAELLVDTIDKLDTITPQPPVGEFETAGELFDRLAVMGADLLVRTLRDIAAGTAPRTPQDHSQATYTRPLTRDDSPIDWTQSPRAIVKHICGLEPWPVATAELGGQTFKIHAADYSERTTHKAPGTIVAAGKDGVTVACAGGQTVRITQLQAPGKKRMSAADYLLGHTLPVED